MKTPTLILICAALFVLFGVLPVTAQSNQLGSIAPAPILVTFDGKYQNLAKLYYQGDERRREPRSVVVLNFMGLKCHPCRKELPLFLGVVRPIVEKCKESGMRIRFFLISTDPLSAKEDLRKFLVDQNIDPVAEALLDPYQKAADTFGVAGIPRTLVISAQGRIAADITGAVDGYKDILQSGIEDALKDEGAK